LRLIAAPDELADQIGVGIDNSCHYQILKTMLEFEFIIQADRRMWF